MRDDPTKDTQTCPRGSFHRDETAWGSAIRTAFLENSPIFVHLPRVKIIGAGGTALDNVPGDGGRLLPFCEPTAPVAPHGEK